MDSVPAIGAQVTGHRHDPGAGATIGSRHLMPAADEHRDPATPAEPPEEEDREQALDQALAETFPASDPVAAEIPER
jgi:hypothetical protein